MNLLRPALLLGVLTLSAPEFNAQSTWNAATGHWTNAANWTPVGVPAGTNVLINNSGIATLTNAAPAVTPGQLYVGSNTVGNQLLITDGGVLGVSTGTVGFAAAGTSNVLTVSNPGSVLSALSFHVGLDGSFNELNLLAGGSLRSTGSVTVGTGATASNNTLLIHGAGAGLRVGPSQTLTIGDNGAGNRLISTNGGRITNLGSFVIGNQAGSSNNIAHLHGTGSVWNTSSSFLLGTRGSGNQLTISGGGVMSNSQFNGVATLGAFPSSSNNTLLVTGTGSVWVSLGFLTIGSNGVNHQMIVADGGLVTNFASTSVGESFSGSGHSVTVSGPGSAWRCGGTVYVGFSSPGCRLIISNGGAVSVAGNLDVGGVSATNQLVLLTNSGSSLAVAGSYLLERGVHRQVDGTATVGYLSHITSSIDGQFQLLGGAFHVTNSSSVGNGGQPFVIGGGSTPALFTLAGGIHSFGASFRIATNGSVQQRSGSVSFFHNTACLVATNPGALYDLQGGSLSINNGLALISNGQVFAVGNGTNLASLTLSTGLHTFADGLLVASNGTLSGRPTLACPLTFLSGSTLAPGSTVGALTNHGTTIWNGGMRYAWEITNATSAPGIGWDLFSASNTVTVVTSPTNRIVLRISGTPANFTNGSAYTWTIATATGGFSGFDTNHVTLDTSALPATNALSAGYFSVTQSGTNLNLVFTPLSFSRDTDGDGITDAAEHQWAPLGFDWQVSQPTLATNFAAIAYGTGFYTTNNIQSVLVNTPLLTRNTTNGLFTLTLAVESSSNLLDYVPFPVSATQTTVNAEGKVEVRFSSPDNASFYRIEAD